LIVSPWSWLVRLVMVWAFAAVSLQPVVDHHFAERIPGHHHLSPLEDGHHPGAVTPDHQHLHQVAHVHKQGASVAASGDKISAETRVLSWNASTAAADGGFIANTSALPEIDRPALPSLPARAIDAAASRFSPGLTLPPLDPPPVLI
jgi:hypothetical protein